MERRRVLVLGQTKENTYEIRNLLDKRGFELEVALSPKIAKAVLLARKMDVLVVHTEVVGEELDELFAFLRDEGVVIPVLLLGEEAGALRGRVPELDAAVRAIDKPYPLQELLASVQELGAKVESPGGP